METDTFIAQATSVDAWLAKSRDLKVSGDTLWAIAWERVTALLEAQRRLTPAEQADVQTAFANLTAAKLLYGLAFETAFKAVILRERAEMVEFHLTADGHGRVQYAELRHFGVSMSAGHDLVKLAEVAGLFGRDERVTFETPDDRDEARKVLESLGDAVVWEARYPVPKHSERWARAELRGSYDWDVRLKLWVDQLLAYYQRPVEERESARSAGDHPGPVAAEPRD